MEQLRNIQLHSIVFPLQIERRCDHILFILGQGYFFFHLCYLVTTFYVTLSSMTPRHSQAKKTEGKKAHKPHVLRALLHNYAQQDIQVQYSGQKVKDCNFFSKKAQKTTNEPWKKNVTKNPVNTKDRRNARGGEITGKNWQSFSLSISFYNLLAFCLKVWMSDTIDKEHNSLLPYMASSFLIKVYTENTAEWFDLDAIAVDLFGFRGLWCHVCFLEDNLIVLLNHYCSYICPQA